MNFNELYKTGCRHIQEKKFEQAREAFIDALAQKKDDIYALNKLAYVLSVLEEPERVQETLEYALKLQREDLFSNYQMGNFLLENARFEEAEAYFRKALKINPRDGYTRNALALLCRNTGRLDEAIRLLEENLRDHPDDHFNAVSLALCHLDRKEHGRAQKICEATLAKDPTHAGARVLLGEVHEYFGRLAEAKSCYETVLAKETDHRMALYNLADLLLREAGSLDRFRLFVLLGENPANRDRPDFRYDIFKEVVTVKNEASLKRALAAFETLHGRYPENVAYLNSLALSRLLSRDFETAREDLKLSLTLDHENPFAHYNLAYLFLVEKRPDQGLDHLEHAVEQDPSDLYAINFLGFLQLFRGFYEKANQSFYRALDLSKQGGRKEDPFSNFGLALLCRLGKDEEGAWRFLQSIVRDHPGTPLCERARKHLASAT